LGENLNLPIRRKSNEYFHVYILFSKANPSCVKVGKANNLKRVPYFSEAGYAGITDWIKALTLVVNSNHAAFALEAMINSKLNNLGYALPKIFWDDLKVEGRRVGATECYNCQIDKTITIGVEMADVYDKWIGPTISRLNGRATVSSRSSLAKFSQLFHTA
jgi:hypothetical protein